MTAKTDSPATPFPSNIEIAQRAQLRPIVPLAQERLGIPPDSLEPYGHYKAKVSLDYLAQLADRPDGKLVLVTAISPTPAGEGKTTTTVGLGDALNLLGKRAMLCLREVIERYLRLVVAVGLEALRRDPQPFVHQRDDRTHLRALRDLDVARKGRGWRIRLGSHGGWGTVMERA